VCDIITIGKGILLGRKMTEEEISKAQDLIFLALTVWREARGESAQCQEMVAKSILRRVELKGWWGSTVLDVVTHQYQYSSMTIKGDANLIKWPLKSDTMWDQILTICSEALSGSRGATEADSYYDTSIPAPKWTIGAVRICQIGRIIFYKTRLKV
jgi:N-acetylmuramoyl-L-alanine amidase